MKKKIIISVSISFVVATSFLFLNSNSKLTKSISLNLASIEALAQDESESDKWWDQPTTNPCKLELGGGMFTASVERVCVFCAVPSSCTPVACGEVFY